MGTVGTGLYRRCQFEGGSKLSLSQSFPCFFTSHTVHLLLLVLHLSIEVSCSDQPYPAVILRQLLVFTTLHAPHFLPSQSLVHFPLPLPQ